LRPFVSIIIPAYNRALYINQTVDSVLDQTYQNIELIVVDDGSSDGTYEKLQEYGARIKLHTHEGYKNKGQSASINVGLSIATGDYIIVLDSDDFWDLNKLQIQVDYFENNADVGLVYTNGYGTNAEGEVSYNYHSDDHTEPNDANAVLLDCYLALPVNSMVRKSVYDQVGGFNESYRAAQDHDMLIRIAEIAKFAYLPDFLFYYRRHSNSISHQNLETRWRVGFHILDAAAKRYPYEKSTLRKRRAVLNYRLGKVLVKKQAYVSGAMCLLKSFFNDPSRALKVLIGAEKVN
jgi:glycosyltransferase involved in cell wall biosynthesis